MAFAETAVPAKQYSWPKSPAPFRIVSVMVECEWKEGRPFASRSELAKLLRISAEGPESVDLIEALAEKGWYVRRDRNGDIQAINPKGVSQGGAIDPKVREKNLSAEKYKPPTAAATPTPAAGANTTNTPPDAGIDPNTGLPRANPNNPNANPNVPPKH